jgi:hypothetical protein
VLRPKFIAPSLVVLTVLIVITACASPLDRTPGEATRREMKA